MNHALALFREPIRARRRTARRVRRLTKDHTRARLAGGLERALADAESGAPRLGAAVPVQRAAVLRCRDDLLTVTERLRSPAPVYAQGVAMIGELLTDAGSPLYQSDGDLRAVLEAAILALDGHLG
jgi:hypothetical protein